MIYPTDYADPYENMPTDPTDYINTEDYEKFVNSGKCLNTECCQCDYYYICDRYLP